jgi:O-antigen ligase
MALYLVVLLVAGGASRMSVSGQIVVRFVSFAYLCGVALWWPRARSFGARPILFLLLATIALLLIQLLPLPPFLWHALPGRDAFVVPGIDPATWRPIAIVPSAAVNAAVSLIVPLVTYLLMMAMPRSQEHRIAGLLLSLVIVDMVLGLIQLSGVPFHDPFVNGRGSVAGTFANRNHFALFLAFGCLLAPVWALRGEQRPTWRLFVALGLLPLLVLTILASGSRAGMLVGMIGLAGGGLLVHGHIRTLLKPYPRWLGPALITAIVLVISILVVLSIYQGRAASIGRVLTVDVDVGSDMRKRSLPTVLAMLRTYFPVGAGFGGFDVLFRFHEPDALLKPTYFNRVHNDFLEVVLDGGIAGAALLLAGLGWWLYATILSMRAGPERIFSQVGGLMILLVIVASIVDYPARTPMIMGWVIIAAVWLHGSTVTPRRSNTMA